MVASMSKYIASTQLATHVKKLQGNLKDAAFAQSIGLTRQALRAITVRGTTPNAQTRAKLGIELVYKIIEPVKAEVAPTPVKTAAKKTANK